MGDYIERAKRFEAKQFKGGVESFHEMCEWLKDIDFMIVSWIPETEREECTGNTNERLVIITGGRAHRIHVGNWIIFKDRDYAKGGPFEVYVNDDFEALWRPAMAGE